MSVTRSTVSQQVVEYLTDRIADGSWKVGGKISSENVLAKELGVSRVSVRLAIQQFIGLGVLESVHGKGTFLKNANLDDLTGSPRSVTRGECRDLAKVLEYRLVVEPGTCRLAARRADRRAIETLRRHLNSQVASIGNSREFVRHDMAFHIEIGRISGNPLLEEGLRDVFDRTRRDHERINSYFGYKDGVYFHSLILKALETGDAKQAQKLMTEHLQLALEQVENSETPDHPQR